MGLGAHRVLIWTLVLSITERVYGYVGVWALPTCMVVLRKRSLSSSILLCSSSSSSSSWAIRASSLLFSSSKADLTHTNTHTQLQYNAQAVIRGHVVCVLAGHLLARGTVGDLVSQLISFLLSVPTSPLRSCQVLFIEVKRSTLVFGH